MLLKDHYLHNDNKVLHELTGMACITTSKDNGKAFSHKEVDEHHHLTEKAFKSAIKFISLNIGF